MAHSKWWDCVFLSPPGGGKDTQCEILMDCHPEISSFSSGAVFRAIEAGDKKVIEQVLKYLPPYVSSNELVSSVQAMRKGMLVDSMYLIAAFRSALHGLKKGERKFWNGLPRNVEQADKMYQLFLESGRVSLAVVELRLSKDEVLKRAALRVLQATKAAKDPRPDDKPEIVGKRFDVHKEQHNTLLDFYRRLRSGGHNINIVSIDASKKVDDIAYDIQDGLWLERVPVKNRFIQPILEAQAAMEMLAA